ncbi:exported hypothetical protein [Gammaproteobacteria bacterium]
MGWRFVLVLLYGLLSPAKAEEVCSAPLGAPGFALRDLEGRIRTLASLKGQVVLVNFWGNWCQPCLADLPLLVWPHIN